MIKKYLSIILLRWLAVVDVLFSKHFELITYRNGRQKSKTELNSNKEWGNKI